MHEVPVTEARAEFSELISRVAYGGEPVVLTRHGKPLVALVPAAYLDEAMDTEATDQSTAQMAVLDVSAMSSDSSGSFTLAAHHQQDPTIR